MERKDFTCSHGNRSISDPERGIGLVLEPYDRPFLWLVVSMFIRTDSGESSKPILIEYGKN